MLICVQFLFVVLLSNLWKYKEGRAQKSKTLLGRNGVIKDETHDEKEVYGH
jgi:hypothetical protein